MQFHWENFSKNLFIQTETQWSIFHFIFILLNETIEKEKSENCFQQFHLVVVFINLIWMIKYFFLIRLISSWNRHRSTFRIHCKLLEELNRWVLDLSGSMLGLSEFHDFFKVRTPEVQSSKFMLPYHVPERSDQNFIFFCFDYWIWRWDSPADFHKKIPDLVALF